MKIEELSQEDYERLNKEASDEEVLVVEGMKFKYYLKVPGQMESIMALGQYSGSIAELLDGAEDIAQGEVRKLKMSQEQAEALMRFAKILTCNASFIPKITLEGGEKALKYDDLPSRDKNKILIELFNQLRLTRAEIEDIQFFREQPDRGADSPTISPKSDIAHPSIRPPDQKDESGVHPET